MPNKKNLHIVIGCVIFMFSRFSDKSNSKMVLCQIPSGGAYWQERH